MTDLRFSSSSIIILFNIYILIYTVALLKFNSRDENKQISKQKYFISSSHNNRKQILIVTEYRSGSSFIGEIFNRNPNIFYLFEPLIMTTIYNKNKKRLDIVQKPKQNKLLKEFFQSCKLPHPKGYISESHFKNADGTKRYLGKCYKSK